jgi:small-conductance mechanosensitive channel
MRLLKQLPAVALAVLLIACLVFYYSTRDTVVPAPGQKAAAFEQALVDTSFLQAAVNLTALAAYPDEQAQAREAWRLADHELDLRFAAVMREAEAQAAVPPRGPLRRLADQVAQLQAGVDADKKRVDSLAKDTTGALDQAQAQLTLDQDELDDAQEDLTRQSGGQRSRLQRLLQEHEASDKIADQTMRYGAPAPTATLNDQVRSWFSLREYQNHLQAAQQLAAAESSRLLAQHDQMQAQRPGPAGTAASAATLRRMASVQKTITGLDERTDDTKQLAAVYQAWAALVAGRRRAVLHQVLGSLASILAIVLGAMVLYRAIRRGLTYGDRRRQHQLRVISRILLQVAAVLGILLIVFGPPTQVSTMIGLITAGVTVVMKDFIMAFFGWFTLMGKNGISVGDWVEVEGVSGEVIEIGILKTVLLELGNWTDTGHPTGRQASFSNSFAMTGHYFNFSTSGQWLWDELRLTLPTSADPYATAQQIREIIERETQADTAEAQKDWERAPHPYNAREFSAAPAVNLRPGAAGLEVVVRYITRAPSRIAVKSKLFQSIVDLLRKPV